MKRICDLWGVLPALSPTCACRGRNASEVPCSRIFCLGTSLLDISQYFLAISPANSQLLSQEPCPSTLGSAPRRAQGTELW